MANKKTNRQTRSTQSRRRREEERKEKERRNRMIAVVGVIVLLVAVGAAYLLLSEGTAGEENDNTAETANETEETAEVAEPEGTLIEGDRPLAELEPAERDAYYDEYPEMIIDTDNSYQAVIRTEKGDMVVQLFDDESPLTVNNFVFLATQGFYDGVVFHRVLPGFMAQGGDPTGSGLGGPGYRFEDEVDNGLSFDRTHLLAMANSGPDTNGSQFFITFVETPQLNGGYSIFGELIQGEDVLNSITLINPENPEDQGRVGDEIERIDVYESSGE